MSDPYWPSDRQMARLAPFFPQSHGKPRLDGKRVLSGMIFINRNGVPWREKGAFARVLPERADQGGGADTRMIDAMHRKIPERPQA